jgi:hypothetical protein
MQYPTRNRSSRQSSYNNLVDIEHNDEKNVATTTKCSKEDTPLSSSRILFNRRQGITSTNMISRLKSRISFHRRQQQRITSKKQQPVINSKKSGEVVSNSNSNMIMNINSDNNSPVLSSSQTCCSTSSGSSSSSSKSTSELGLQSNKLVEGSSQQKQPPPPPPQQKEEKEEKLPRSYVDAILKVYGTPQRRSSSSSSVSSSLYVADNDDDVDLYRDVLQISSKASNREIQMAYIREGRSMLITTNNDKDNNSSSSARSTELLDDRGTKLKFIALSMAHEILSTPSLKEIYDTTHRQQSGGGDDNAGCCKLSKSDHSQSKPKEKQVSPVKVLRASSYNTNVGRDIIFGRSSSLPSSLLLSNGIARSSTGLSALTSSSSSSSSSSSIRWKDHVEEIKFIGHPNEHEKWIRKAAKSEEKEKQKQQQQQKLENHTKTERTNTSSSSSTSTSQYCTSIPEELESRLVAMDADVGGERLFVKDFWDTFEDSLDTVINVGGCCTNMNYLYTCSTPA